MINRDIVCYGCGKQPTETEDIQKWEWNGPEQAYCPQCVDDAYKAMEEEAYAAMANEAYSHMQTAYAHERYMEWLEED